MGLEESLSQGPAQAYSEFLTWLCSSLELDTSSLVGIETAVSDLYKPVIKWPRGEEREGGGGENEERYGAAVREAGQAVRGCVPGRVGAERGGRGGS